MAKKRFSVMVVFVYAGLHEQGIMGKAKLKNKMEVLFKP